jgi:hypothetical protein
MKRYGFDDKAHEIESRDESENRLSDVLDYYRLRETKRIPTVYLYSDPKTRYEILAGVIDSLDATLHPTNVEIKFTDINRKLINDIKFLSQSLGLQCIESHRKTYMGISQTTLEKVHIFYFILHISGRNLAKIPTRHPHKCMSTLYKKHDWSWSSTTQILVTKQEKPDEYYGFMTDGSHRFLLGDFTVTHNCLNVRNSNPASIAKNAVITDLVQALGLQD